MKLLTRSHIVLLLLFIMLMVSWVETSAALDVVHEGTARPGEVVGGFRAGPGFRPTPGLSTVGPALSFQGLYGVNRWLRVGLTLDWTQHNIQQAPGSFSTVTLLPAYLEFRPGRVGDLEPYVASGLGVNINNKDVSNTLAFRVAGGVDYQLRNWFSNAPKGLALNTEVTFTRNATEGNDLASVAWLFGARWSFGGRP